MPRSRKVTTVCNGKREVWMDYEQAKAYFLELMMSTDGEEHERAECGYIQLLHRLDECSYKNKYSKNLCRAFYFAPTTYGNAPQHRLTLRSRNF